MNRYLTTIYHAHEPVTILSITRRSTGQVRAAIERDYPNADAVVIERRREASDPASKRTGSR